MQGEQRLAMIQLENGLSGGRTKGIMESLGELGAGGALLHVTLLENIIKFITHCEMQVESAVSWKYDAI